MSNFFPLFSQKHFDSRYSVIESSAIFMKPKETFFFENKLLLNLLPMFLFKLMKYAEQLILLSKPRTFEALSFYISTFAFEILGCEDSLCIDNFLDLERL